LGINYISDIDSSEFKSIVASKKLIATSNYEYVKQTDIVIICVPTPLDKYQQPDISYIKSVTDSIGKYLHEYMLIVLESTTYPGTTEELVLPILENKSGLHCEKDLYLAFSPERVDPGNINYSIKNTTKIVGGVGKESTEVAASYYRNILESDVYEVSSPKVAELEKILENTYRNINIGLINEMAIICNKMGISIWEIIDAAKTKPYGFHAFYPGPGLGGHCIPLDPYYLTWKAREYGYHTRFIELSGEINNYMPQYVVERCIKILNKLKKSLNSSKVLVLGVAYKQDINDYRESPALKVIELFQKEGAKVKFFDPYISSYNYKGEKFHGLEELTADKLKAFDLVVITTSHTNINYDFIQRYSNIIFDTKNAMKKVLIRSNIEVL